MDFEEVATSSCSEVIIIMSNDFFQPVANSLFLVTKKSSAFACISSQGSLQMVNENSNSNP